jgi:LSU ribosomal protein L32P
MHLFLEKPNMTVCKKCGKPVMSHIVCPACGFYKGKEVIDVLSKLDRRQRRAKEMEIAKTQAESEVAAKQTAK